MSTPTLITGLPRSRTAWLALFFDVPHEAMGGFDSVGQLLSAGVSTSDSSLCLFADDAIQAAQLDLCGLVVVHRPEQEARESLRLCWHNRLGLTSEQIVNRLAPGYRKLCECKAAFHIDFKELSNEPKMRELWNYVYPGRLFPLERFLQMRAMRVTQIFDVALARLAAA